MPRVYIDRPLASDTAVDLDERQTRYLARALRLRVGDPVVLFDGSGTEYPATLTSIRRNDSVVHTGEGRIRSVESSLDIRLLQAVCKGEKMEKQNKSKLKEWLDNVISILGSFFL